VKTITPLRLFILVFLAVLTATTASANSVLFQVYVGTGGTQSTSLTLDGNLVVGAYYGYPAGSLVINQSVDLPQGWNPITIVYDNISGTAGFTVMDDAGWMPLIDLASYDSSGKTIQGLQGTYAALDPITHLPTTSLFTDYGEGPIHFTGGVAPWSGNYNGFTLNASSHFQETLTGFFYNGTGTPSLADVPAQQQSSGGGGGDTGGGSAGADAPEPDALWLMALALPLMLFSKLRLRSARIRA